MYNDFSKEELSSFKYIAEFLKKNKEIVAMLVILVALIYANSLKGEFVADDPRMFNSPVITDLGTGLKTLNAYAIPITVSNHLFGQNPIPMHIWSVFQHMIMTVLVFILISMLFNKRVGAIAALLFAVHPINTEAVDWISGRKYLTGGIIHLTTLIIFLIYRYSKNWRYLAIGSFFWGFFLITLRDPWLFVTPLLLIVVDLFLVVDRFDLKRLKYILPIIGVSAIVFLITMIGRVQDRISYLTDNYDLYRDGGNSIFTRIPYSIYSTFKLMIYPKDLTLYHEAELISKGYFAVMVIFTLSLFLLLIYLFYSKKYKLLGLLLFILAALAPTFSPIQVSWFVAERYMYTSTVAFTTLTALFIIGAERTLKIKNLTVYLLITLLAIYSIRTIVRNNEWKTRKSVWESTARVSPYSPRVYNNLGDVYGLEGDIPRAIQMFETAIKLDPNYAEAIHNLGNAYVKAGDLDKAYEQYQKAYTTDPRLYQSLHLMGVIEMERQNFDAATNYFNKALEINPEFKPAIQGLQMVQNQ